MQSYSRKDFIPLCAGSLALESVRYQESDVYVSKAAQCAYVDGRYLATLPSSVKHARITHASIFFVKPKKEGFFQFVPICVNKPKHFGLK